MYLKNLSKCNMFLISWSMVHNLYVKMVAKTVSKMFVQYNLQPIDYCRQIWLVDNIEVYMSNDFGCYRNDFGVKI